MLPAPARGDVKHCDRLAIERTAADEPVEGVLERPRDTERVFRDREQDSVRLGAGLAEPLHCFGRERLEIRIEMRERPG